MLPWSNKTRKPIIILCDTAMNDIEEPLTYDEVINESEKKNWNNALQVELSSVKLNNNWLKVNLQP